MDTTMTMAREAHRKVREYGVLAGHWRAQRDAAIRELYGGGEYSYAGLARQIGCSTELVAKVCQGR